MPDKVLILDFGSQVTQLIARRIRELNVYCEVEPFNFPLEKIKNDKSIKAIVLSGGPDSVYEKNAPAIDLQLLDLGLPVLGICYGLQIISHSLGGKVEPSPSREYGRAEVRILDKKDLFAGLGDLETVWMSHGDHSISVPSGFSILASTATCPVAAMGNIEKNIFAIQFHPEVYHTKNGRKMIENFLFKISKLEANWTSRQFIETKIEEIKNKVKDKKVLCGLSGGVDSAVTAAIIHRAIGKQLHCMFVDHGLLRSGEREEVETVFKKNFAIPLTVIDAKKAFLNRLKNVTDPEEKRKIIGKTFIEVFEMGISAIDDKPGLEFLQVNEIEQVNKKTKASQFEFLAQGTLYPDVVESVSYGGGPSQTIKSHHNVGGLPKDLNFDLVEPLRELFKDEVRKAGKELGLPDTILQRHPFPGPGLAIRIIGDVDEEKIRILQQADKIFTDELKNTINSETQKTLYEETWQAFAVLTPVKSVGVMGDGRTYENLLGLRAVTAIDGMTADWARLPYDFLAKVSNKIINEVKGINRVVYDISSKPPATIEWE